MKYYHLIEKVLLFVDTLVQHQFHICIHFSFTNVLDNFSHKKQK